jgi:hypothetical protein
MSTRPNTLNVGEIARSLDHRASAARRWLAASGLKTMPSFLRFTTIEGIERKQDLTDLTPK